MYFRVALVLRVRKTLKCDSDMIGTLSDKHEKYVKPVSGRTFVYLHICFV